MGATGVWMWSGYYEGGREGVKERKRTNCGADKEGSDLFVGMGLCQTLFQSWGWALQETMNEGMNGRMQACMHYRIDRARSVAPVPQKQEKVKNQGTPGPRHTRP